MEKTTREQLLSIILEHALRHRYHTLTKAILEQTTNTVDAPDIYKAICILEKILATKRIEQFHLLAELIEAIYHVDAGICPFKIYSKLLLGIKMKFLLEYLKCSDEDTEFKLNKYLPAKNTATTDTDSKEYIQHEESVNSFREFFLPLLKDKKDRGQYFRNEYEEEFGEGFLLHLKRLMNAFLMQLERHLPLTKLEMLLSRRQEFSQSNKGIHMLLKFLEDHTVLSEEGLLKFLHTFHDANVNTYMAERPKDKQQFPGKRTEVLQVTPPRNELKVKQNAKMMLDSNSEVLNQISAAVKSREWENITRTAFKNNKDTVKESVSEVTGSGIDVNSKNKTQQLFEEVSKFADKCTSENIFQIANKTTEENDNSVINEKTKISPTKKLFSEKYKSKSTGNFESIVNCTNKQGTTDNKTDTRRKVVECDSEARALVTDQDKSNKKENVTNTNRVTNSENKLGNKKSHKPDEAKFKVNKPNVQISTKSDQNEEKRKPNSDEKFKSLNKENRKIKRKFDKSEDKVMKKKILSPEDGHIQSVEVVDVYQKTEVKDQVMSKEYTAEIWKCPSGSFDSNICHELSPVNPDQNNIIPRMDITNCELDDFPVIPPSDKDTDSDIELDDFENEIGFQDQKLPDTCIPTLENFRITSPIKLCVVKLYGKKDGIYS